MDFTNPRPARRVLWVCLAILYLAPSTGWSGSILREVWQGIGGTAVSDLTGSPNYPNSPTSTNLVTVSFEAPTDVLDNYGQRLHGYLVAPVTGNYTFWIASDDGGELWLSTDDTPANKRLIATVNGWTPSQQWGWEPNQQSAPIALQQGRYYYVAALMKEGGGGDNLAVRWLRPDGADEGPIPATHLQPWGVVLQAPQISEQPTNTSAVEGQLARFQVKLSSVGPASYQWRRNGLDLAGARSSVLDFGPVTLADQGARFSVYVTNNLGNATSTDAVLTVVPDTTRPTLGSALNLGPTTLRVIFSEPVAAPSATTAANYRLNNGASVTGAAFGSDTRTVVLTTSALSYGTVYTLTVSNVTDRAATPNPILPGSQLVFTASEYAPADIGSPPVAGGSVTVPGGVDVTGAGADIGGTADQFQFSYREVTGDFDLQARVAGVTVPDPFMQAGLMVRDSLAANARFAGIFASSPQLGCFFESRATAGAASSVSAPRRPFAVNYPEMWLRLRRAGSTFFGFASQDGLSWVQLGTVTLSSAPATLYYGLAVCSGNASAAATAAFRNLASTTSTAAGTEVVVGEPLGPSSRRTGIIFSEIMYHPRDRTDGRHLEFIELYNARSVEEDLTGWHITGEVDYQFPDGFKLPAGAFVAVATDPDDLKTVYGITNVLGPFLGGDGTNAIPNDAGTIRLRNNAGAVRLEVDYSDNVPWPAAADGAGHSLVLVRPSYGENDARAWAPSQAIGGSPGGVDPVVPAPQAAVAINEILAHTDLPAVDYVELFNASNATVDLSGCVLTDDASTNRFRIPNGTTIGARGFLAFDTFQLGFNLDAGGETIYLVNSNATRVLDALRFGGQENGVALGRWPDGAPSWRRLASQTPGAANARWRSEAVVINEIMYHPISADADEEYVELHNRSGALVDLSDWRFSEGIDYQFPSGTTIPANGYLVVARNASRLLATHSALSPNLVRGNFDGSLADGGERLVLQMPDTVVGTNDLGLTVTNVIRINIAEVTYSDGGRWGQWADGGGSSLELIDPAADPTLAANWRDSDESAKSTWTSVSVTGTLDNGNVSYSPDRLFIGMLGPGECLVDDIQVFRSGGANLVGNPAFESGSSGWSFFGNHSTSGVEAGSGYNGSGGLHVRGQGDGDTGPNTIRTALAAGLASGNTGTISARVRWLAGWPEVLFRLHGNYLELPGRMDLPSNLGTPGLVNSRRVANAGPAIYDVRHTPPLPRASEAVVVTCRVSDASPISSLLLRYRVDPSATLSNVTLRDDGTGGDALAGDGTHSATISGRTAGTLVAFRIEARDDDAGSLTTVFPAGAPAQECLVRWDDAVPFGNFSHYHLWSTQATESQRTAGLNNTWRDATLVYGNQRVVYNVGFRDKGSPWHGGYGDIAANVPPDDLLLGETDRVFASTGNGGSEGTAIRSQLAAWLAQRMGIPYLHAQYMLLYYNGGLFREVMEDLEQPNHNYSESWFPEADAGDLYKVAMWFEFNDDNSGFNATGATIQQFRSGGNYKLARYRWTFQRRANDGLASNYTNLFSLVTTINDSTAGSIPRLLVQADMEQWMRSYIFAFVMGNWDAWSYNVGQNMFLYKPYGRSWVLMPWDIDFTFGLGDGSSGTLWNGQDPSINRLYAIPEYRRMVWRAYQDVVTGPYLQPQYGPQIEMRRRALLRNNITGLQTASGITNYIEARRSYVLNQLNSADTSTFALTVSGGNNYTSTTPATVLTGTSPIAVAVIEINGIPYPVTWSTVTGFSITVPLTQVTNVFTLVGRDLRGNVVSGATDTITVTYTGAIERPEDYVVLNEVHYNPLQAGASFVEIYNRSSKTPFDLSGCRLDGLGYTFPDGAIVQPGAFLVLAKDAAAFQAAFGSVPVFDEFPGQLDNGGERLALVRPGATPELDLVISDVRYDDRLPWPPGADGQGPSLQVIDAAQDEYRVGNWAATPTNDVNRVTPGRANALVQTLPAFPPLWINEVLPSNITGPTDAAGEHEPWIELFNSGTTNLDLSAFYLTDTYTNLAKWQFPSGTVLGPQQFLLVWADGEPGEVDPGRLHASFRLNPTNGAVALVRMQGTPTQPAVMDYVDYVLLSPDRSFGAIPDGEPRRRRLLHYPTPGGTNDPASLTIQVFINEFMARNNTTITDPADGDNDDWFELYNAGATAVDLSSYTLTDNRTNKTEYRILPGYSIPPGGFLLVWADGETGQNNPTNADLHVSFQLNGDGEQLGLYGPDGVEVDAIDYGAQTNDVSLGRYPDGGLLPLVVQDVASPRAPNVLFGGNRPPVVGAPVSTNVLETTPLVFTVTATDPDAGQTVRISLGTDAPAGATLDSVSGQFAWTPTEGQGPGSYTFTLLAVDNGVPVRTGTASVTVTVLESNRPPVLNAIDPISVNEGALLNLTLTASDPDVPANGLTFSVEPGAPAGLTVEPTSGVVTWVPMEAQGPASYNVTFRVADDGSPERSATRSVSLTVNEVNNPPDMPFVPSQSTPELTTFRCTVQATDPDTPSAPILFAFDLAPPGAAIDPSTGEITWTPTELQGPTNALLVVRASENVPGGLSSTRTFSVGVTELNEAPTLGAIGSVTVLEGETVSFQATATDSDLPAQPLTFSLEPGAPAGASIDPSTGQFVWHTSPDQGATARAIGVRVTDSYGASQARTFTVTVLPTFHLVLNEIMHRPSAADAEYVELWNTSSNSTADLSGLILAGNSLTFTFPAGTTLAPRGYLCVAADPTAFGVAYGAGLRVVGPWTGTFTEPDTITLIQPGTGGQPEVLLDTVTFDRGAPWPTEADGGGASLQLIDATQDNDRVGNWAATAPAGGQQTLVSMTQVWRYYQSGPLSDFAWRSNSFNDLGWPSGAALLYNETAALPAPANTPLTLGPLTFYFRTTFTLPAVPAGATLQLSTVLDDGAVYWLNGRELFRTNLPAGDITPDVTAPAAVGDATLQGPFTLPADLLQPGVNLLAVEVHQVNSTSSDVVMGCSLDLVGGIVPTSTPAAPNNVIRALPEFPALRLNEVLARNTTGLIDRVGDREPWLEIVNTGNAVVSLDGLKLTDDPAAPAKWAFPSGVTIPVGGHLVVFVDGEPGESSLSAPVELHAGFRLPTTSGTPWWLAITRPDGSGSAVVDYLVGAVGGENEAFGRAPDGNPAAAMVLATPTPGGVNSSPAAGAPEIIDVTLNAQAAPVITSTALTGRSYRLEYKPGLSTAPWQPLQTLTAGDATLVWTDATAIGQLQRYYRIVLLP